jgi:hypothetical protein
MRVILYLVNVWAALKGDIEKIDIPVAAKPLDMSARVSLPQSGAGPLQLRELT